MSRVYFIKPCGQLGPVKIGFTVQLERRVIAHEVQSPLILELVCSARGGREEERLLHERFAGQHMHGEWFAWSKDLQAVIDEVKETGVLPSLSVQWPRATLRRQRRPSFALSRVKANLTRRVNDAERRHYPWPAERKRPADIAALVASYQGAHKPPPSSEQVEILESYIGRLTRRAVP